MSDYDHTNPYTSGIRKGRARPRSSPVRVCNYDNMGLRAEFHKRSKECRRIDPVMEEFTYIDKKDGQEKRSGLPQNLLFNGVNVDLSHRRYKDTPFRNKNGGRYFLYQRQVKEITLRNGKTKTQQWFDNHHNKRVYVITPSMGGRMIKGTLTWYDEKDLWIKV